MTSASAQTFACPACGAALVAQGNQTQLACPYCRTTVVVPEAVRPKELAQPVVVVVPSPVVNNFYNYQNPPAYPLYPSPTIAPVGRKSGYGCLGVLVALFIVAILAVGALALIFPRISRQVVAEAQLLIIQSNRSPQVLLFTANPYNVRPGQSTVLNWVTNADHVKIEMISVGQTTTWNYPGGTGTTVIPLTANNNVDSLEFRLTAFKSGLQNTIALRIVVDRR